MKCISNGIGAQERARLEEEKRRQEERVLCSDITEHTCIVAEAVGWRLLCAGRRGAREGPCGGRGTWSYCWRQVKLSWFVFRGMYRDCAEDIGGNTQVSKYPPT